MLARPGIRSVIARFPWVAFGFGPILILALVVAAALLMQGARHLVKFVATSVVSAVGEVPIDAVNWLATYAAPLAIALVLCIIGIRQRIAVGWIVLGLSLVCVVGGFHEIGVRWSTVPRTVGARSQLRTCATFSGTHDHRRDCTEQQSIWSLVGAGYWLWLHLTSGRVVE